ncbi:ATP12 family chaperone protein [Thermaurantiacus sp.]
MRFWHKAVAAPVEGGHGVLLDGRPVRTPKRALLAVPTAALAEAIAAEWAEVAATVDPRTMLLTGLANAAIDVVAPDPAQFAAGLAAYGASDLTCYRAEAPAELVGRQVAAWEPALKAVERAHDLVFRRTTGVLPVAQPAETLARLEVLLAAFSPFQLAALSPVVTLSGSVVLGLALAAGLIDAERAFAAAEIDFAWQAERWGEDAEATAARDNRAMAFRAAAKFLALASDRRG